jgi:hypothetical protein
VDMAVLDDLYSRVRSTAAMAVVSVGGVYEVPAQEDESRTSACVAVF